MKKRREDTRIKNRDKKDEKIKRIIINRKK